MRTVVIRGDGVAAYCCAYLLGKAGFQVVLEPVHRPRLPAILLGQPALALIREIFQREDLLRDAPLVRKRMVAWGPDSKLLALDHSAVVVSEELLLSELSTGLVLSDPAPGIAPEWTVFASRPLPAPTLEHPFGSRIASALRVTLKDDAEPAACWIESLETGWLFLIPDAPGSAWLLAVGGTLGSSRVIAKQVANSSDVTAGFPAYPRIISPLAGPGWLACGSAAMAFDPLSGDGAAHAIREAILASAVIRAGSKDGVLAHYEARLTAGFKRHLSICRDFYKSGAAGPWWDRELEAMERGIQWCNRRLSDHGSFRYQLQGFDLQ